MAFLKKTKMTNWIVRIGDTRHFFIQTPMFGGFNSRNKFF